MDSDRTGHDTPAEKGVAPATTSGWANDGRDALILLSSLLLILASIALLVLIFVFHALEFGHVPEGVQALQRAISALSLTITSAVVMLIGKRYMFSKLSSTGIRSHRIALYSNATIGNITGQFLRFRFESLSLGLLLAWIMALATGVTVNNAVRLAPFEGGLYLGLPVGSLDPTNLFGDNTSLVGPASAMVDYVVSSLVSGVDGVVGLINITSAQTTGGEPMGSIYYPPLPDFALYGTFQTPAVLNAFQIAVDQPASVPSTAQKLNCTAAYGNSSPDLWFSGADTQSFSIIIGMNSTQKAFYYQFTSTAIVMGGTLSAQRQYTDFALNGTTWSLTMSDTQWASQIVDVICSTVTPSAGDYGGTSLLDFAYWINERDMYQTNYGNLSTEMAWTTVLGTVVGAYSASKFPMAPLDYVVDIHVTNYNDMRLTPYYGVYVLIVNTVILIILLFAAWRLNKGSDLGTDFMDPTRLLLDSLTKPELFKASLETTVAALGDPYVVVTEENQLLVKLHK
ncbi:hypothetical protein BS17DRAFT_790370 [Gyrodon lividus]|nr:hypothetical protein BS17DRAFT_790370 [Gyrodon lividus]